MFYNECHDVQCHNAEGCYTECNDAECHDVECHKAEGCYTECHDAESLIADCCYTKYHDVECLMLNVVILSVMMLSV